MAMVSSALERTCQAEWCGEVIGSRRQQTARQKDAEFFHRRPGTYRTRVARQGSNGAPPDQMGRQHFMACDTYVKTRHGRCSRVVHKTRV